MLLHDVPDLPAVRDTLVVWKREADGLHAVSLGGYESRHAAVLSLLETADLHHVVPATGPVLVHTLDRPVATAAQPWRSHAFCTADGFVDVPVPDFVFGGWPEVGIDDFDETCWAVQVAGDEPARLPVVGWIGSAATHPVRTTLLRLGEEHPDLIDAQQVDWVRDPHGARLRSAAGNSLTLEEQVRRWSALLDVEGMGYSGRLKLLLHSGRPVLVQDRPWREWFWDSLVPMEHYVPVRRDLADLADRARWVQQHPQEAATIGRAGQKLAQQLLTRSSAVEQWARTLTLASSARASSTEAASTQAASAGIPPTQDCPAEAPPAGGEWAPAALRNALRPALRRLGVST